MDSNLMHIRNIVRQGGKVSCIVKRLNYLYQELIIALAYTYPVFLTPLFIAVIVNHYSNYVHKLIYGVATRVDQSSAIYLCDVVNVSWKKKYIDMRTKHRYLCKTCLVFCPDEWLVRHESPNRFLLET